jgi:hypothetical protein
LTLSFNQSLSLAQTAVEVNFTVEASAIEWQILFSESVKFDDGSEGSVTLTLDETCPYELSNIDATVVMR